MAEKENYRSSIQEPIKIINSDIKICGARLRNGSECTSLALLNGGRCRNHGGLSTGPKTLEGRRRSALNIGKDYDELLQIKEERFARSTRTRARKP